MSEIKSEDEGQYVLTWRDFADGLAQLSRVEGASRFLDDAFRLLNQIVTVDSCSVFKISSNKTSGAKHLCTFGTLDTKLADLLAAEYVKTGYLKDPIVQTALPIRYRVRHVPSHHYGEDYRNDYFRKADIIDKVMSLHSTRSALFSFNFYRKTKNGKFSNLDLSDLERLGPILSQYVLRHLTLQNNIGVVDKEYLDRKVGLILDDDTSVFARLSKRECEVCRGLLAGETEKEIAFNLGVALTTIITYRKRLYEKLQISMKEELFQLAIIEIS